MLLYSEILQSTLSIASARRGKHTVLQSHIPAKHEAILVTMDRSIALGQKCRAPTVSYKDRIQQTKIKVIICLMTMIYDVIDRDQCSIQVQSTVRKQMATGTFTYNALRAKTLKERIKTQGKFVSH